MDFCSTVQIIIILQVQHLQHQQNVFFVLYFFGIPKKNDKKALKFSIGLDLSFR